MEGDIHPYPIIDIPFLTSLNIIYMIFNWERHDKPNVLQPLGRTVRLSASKWIYSENIRSALSNAENFVLISLIVLS